MTDRSRFISRPAKANKPKRFNQTVPASNIFKGLLPGDYKEKWGQIQQYQQFFQSQESDAVFQMVTVANVTNEYLHVSVPNPALSNYLRLHKQQVEAMLVEYFGVVLELKISSRPETNAVALSKADLKPAPHFTEKVCSNISDAANSIDDDALKAALKSLSETLKE